MTRDTSQHITVHKYEDLRKVTQKQPSKAIFKRKGTVPLKSGMFLFVSDNSFCLNWGCGKFHAYLVWSTVKISILGVKYLRDTTTDAPPPPHHHQERKSSFDIFVTYLNLCHSWGALRGGICCPSFWGWAPFLVGSKNFQHFDPREVLETQPTPFLNQLSALEPILFLSGQSL